MKGIEKHFSDWFQYLVESNNIESYEAGCDCWTCRDIRAGYEKWKQAKNTELVIHNPS